MTGATLAWAALIGVGIGFLGGLLGKGGSAVATPLLHLAGVPAIVAVASPLPATIPSTVAASRPYARARLVDRRVVRWTTAVGVPATIAGSLLTRRVDADALVTATDVVLVLLGLRLLTRRTDGPDGGPAAPPTTTALVATATVVGLISGLLANSGGFLLAPLFVTALHLPIRRALASSLAAASVLAVPGTLTHAYLGHIDWLLVVVLASTSVPLSFVGARVALRSEPRRLERAYGAALAVLGLVFVALR